MTDARRHFGQRLVLRLEFTVVVAVLLAGCAPRATDSGGAIEVGASPDGMSAPQPPADSHQCTSNAGTYVVRFVTDPNPIPLNEMFTIRFWVEPIGAKGIAVDSLDVAVDARMPQHHHGMYRQPKVTSLGGGCFEATGMLFHMPGYWEMYFDITHAGLTERAQAPAEID